MISLFPYSQFPPQGLRQIDGSGKLLNPLYYLLQALYKRTGGNSGILWTVGANLTATGFAQNTALAITNDYNEVLTGIGLSVVLAQLQVGQQQWVFNGTGGNLRIFPPVGGQIDALGPNNFYLLSNGKTQIFTCPSLLGSVSFYRSCQLG